MAGELLTTMDTIYYKEDYYLCPPPRSSAHLATVTNFKTILFIMVTRSDTMYNNQWDVFKASNPRHYIQSIEGVCHNY